MPSSFLCNIYINLFIRLRVQLGCDVESLLDDGALFVQGDTFLKGVREGRASDAATPDNAGTPAAREADVVGLPVLMQKGVRIAMCTEGEAAPADAGRPVLVKVLRKHTMPGTTAQGPDEATIDKTNDQVRERVDVFYNSIAVIDVSMWSHVVGC
jgi:hypothetical protein